MKTLVQRLLISSLITALIASALFAPLTMWASIGPPIFIINLVVLALALRGSHKSQWPRLKKNLACLATGTGVLLTLWIYTCTVPRLFPEPQEKFRSWVLERPMPTQ